MEFLKQDWQLVFWNKIQTRKRLKKNYCLLGQSTACRCFQGSPPFSSYKTALKQQWNVRRRILVCFWLRVLVCIWLRYIVFHVQRLEACRQDSDMSNVLLALRLLQDNVCTEKNIPSISSINRIIRDKAMTHRRGFDFGLSEQGDVSSSQCLLFSFFIHSHSSFDCGTCLCLSLRLCICLYLCPVSYTHLRAHET